MLNKLSRSLPTLVFILQLSACAVTHKEEEISSSAGKNQNYMDAVAALKSGDLKEARNLFLEVIDKHPRLANAHVNMGIIFIKNKSFDEAENAFNRALEINPQNIYALNQLGFIYRKQGDFSKAKTSYEKAIDINPNYTYAHLNLGILYDLYLYELENAIEQYKIYNKLLKDEDKLVVKWIFDLERRLKKSLSQKQ